jgi:hypothetical protein
MGRLDGAERIITALLPDSLQQAEREQLITEAHLTIIAEEVGLEDDARLNELLKNLSTSGKNVDSEQGRNLLFLAENLKDNRLKFALGAYLGNLNQLEHFKAAYRVDRAFEPQDLLRTAARGTKVLGQMLESFAEAQRLDKKRIRWVTRLAQIFYGLVEVAVPNSVPHLIFRHWLKLLYLFELLMVVAGIAFVTQPVQQFGLLTFAVTVTVHTAILVMGDLMRGRRVWLNLVLGMFVISLIALSVIGILTLFAVFGQGDYSLKYFTLMNQLVHEDVGRGWNKKTILFACLIGIIALFFLAAIRKDLWAALLDLRLRWRSFVNRMDEEE